MHMTKPQTLFNSSVTLWMHFLSDNCLWIDCAVWGKEKVWHRPVECSVGACVFTDRDMCTYVLQCSITLSPSPLYSLIFYLQRNFDSVHSCMLYIQHSQCTEVHKHTCPPNSYMYVQTSVANQHLMSASIIQLWTVLISFSPDPNFLWN